MGLKSYSLHCKVKQGTSLPLRFTTPAGELSRLKIDPPI